MDTLSHIYTGWDRTSSVTTPFGAVQLIWFKAHLEGKRISIVMWFILLYEVRRNSYMNSSRRRWFGCRLCRGLYLNKAAIIIYTSANNNNPKNVIQCRLHPPGPRPNFLRGAFYPSVALIGHWLSPTTPTTVHNLTRCFSIWLMFVHEPRNNRNLVSLSL